MKEKIEELTAASEKAMEEARKHLQGALDTLKKAPGKGKEAEIKALEEELRHVERSEAMFREHHRVAITGAEQREKLQRAMEEAEKAIRKTEEEIND